MLLPSSWSNLAWFEVCLCLKRAARKRDVLSGGCRTTALSENPLEVLKVLSCLVLHRSENFTISLWKDSCFQITKGHSYAENCHQSWFCIGLRISLSQCGKILFSRLSRAEDCHQSLKSPARRHQRMAGFGCSLQVGKYVNEIAHAAVLCCLISQTRAYKYEIMNLPSPWPGAAQAYQNNSHSLDSQYS